MKVDFYIKNSYEISKLIAKRYSTSFYLATLTLNKEMRRSIFAIYGFVRIADEIVDSFHDFDKSSLLANFNNDMQLAIKTGISTNPVLASFSDTVNKYSIDTEFIEAFMKSMKLDFEKIQYMESKELKDYIYGSADVVGLMCLKVFCNKNQELFNELKHSAQKLGSAFQKLNFLRDLKDDINNLGRSYFPEITEFGFNQEIKSKIEASITEDFRIAFTGIKKLPGRSKLAVSLAYFYYTGLFQKIKNCSPESVLRQRIRISNFRKYLILIKTIFIYKFKII